MNCNMNIHIYLPIMGKYFHKVPITGNDFGPGIHSKGFTDPDVEQNLRQHRELYNNLLDIISFHL